MASKRFTRRPAAPASAAPNAAMMSEAEFKAFQQRKVRQQAAAAEEKRRLALEAATRERQERARAAAAVKAQRLLQQRMEASKAHDLAMEEEAAERNRQRAVEEARKQREEALARKDAERRAEVERELRAAEEEAVRRVAAEREARLDERRNKSIDTAMGNGQRANKAVADADAEVRAWEAEIEAGRAVVYSKIDGRKFAFNPSTKATFWLGGTHLDALPAAPEATAATGALLMDEGALQRQVEQTRQRSLALEARTAAFLSEAAPAPTPSATAVTSA